MAKKWTIDEDRYLSFADCTMWWAVRVHTPQDHVFGEEVIWDRKTQDRVSARETDLNNHCIKRGLHPDEVD